MVDVARGLLGEDVVGHCVAEDAFEEGCGDAGAGCEGGVGGAARTGDVVCEVESVDGAEGDFVRALGNE